MSAPDSSREARRAGRIEEAIAAYLQAADAGAPPDPVGFLAAHPDIEAELKEFLENTACAGELLAPLRTRPVREDGLGVATTPSSAGSGGLGRFGKYELLAEIARGGMGIVYRARDTRVGRIVALKRILAGEFASEGDVLRFEAEAEAAAHLDHPGIVPVFEVGECEGEHYFSMGYVEGVSLAELLREGPMESRQAAELLVRLCDAVQHAHDHGVVHRDLKPANILLESNRDGTGHGHRRPRVTDFGLAKRLFSDANLTRTGEVVGTPSYMAPEQAVSGAHDAIGPAADIYSLGAILYQLLTGRPPFQAETTFETISQLLEAEPLPPRLLNRSVPRDLESICMKCLAKEPVERYASARCLSEDLSRYLTGEVIRASGVNLLERVTRAVRQSRHDEELRGWGMGLIAFGVVILSAHVAIYFLPTSTYGRWAYFLPRVAMFGALLALLFRLRQRPLLPANAPERLIWVVWGGYLLSLGAMNAVRALLGRPQSDSYALFAVLTGLGFLITGGQTWGGGFVVGLVFFVAGPLLAVVPQTAPLIFGGLWALGLLAFGLHYRRR